MVVFEPLYDSYAAGDRDGRRAPPGRHAAAAGLVVRPRRAGAAVTARTRLLLLNSPHNPTGKVFSRAELEQVAAVCREHDLVAVTDEVYEHLVFEGEHVPLATLDGMAERTITISSLGKTFSVTGWKIGWASGPPELVGRRARREAVPVVRGRRRRSSTRAPPRSRSATSSTPSSRPG